MQLRTITATRYVTPLREGGSLPAIIEADDDGMYVLKFRGAGQGTKALVAELLVGELAREIGLPVPEIVLVQLDPALARTEPDPEIQELIGASAGINLAMDYLPGSVTFDPAVDIPSSLTASAIVWFDALTTNVDRTARNANMLMWHKKLYLIDHGAALYLQHTGRSFLSRSRDRFRMIKDHVLLRHADALAEADATLTKRITPEKIDDILRNIPDDWLTADAEPVTRAEYSEWLCTRLSASHDFLEEALHARSLFI
jgi:hypothetical protein